MNLNEAVNKAAPALVLSSNVTNNLIGSQQSSTTIDFTIHLDVFLKLKGILVVNTMDQCSYFSQSKVAADADARSAGEWSECTGSLLWLRPAFRDKLFSTIPVFRISVHSKQKDGDLHAFGDDHVRTGG
jgi:hypothetical protein